MLTAAQKTTLAAAIAADPTLSAFPNTSDGNFDLAQHLSFTLPSPAFRVWRTNLPTKDVKKAIVWAEYIGSTSVGERDALNLIISNGIVDASDPNVRQAFLTIFGSPQQATTRANLTNIAKRDATLIEKILATGTGSEGSPATMTFEGIISATEVADARGGVM